MVNDIDFLIQKKWGKMISGLTRDRILAALKEMEDFLLKSGETIGAVCVADSEDAKKLLKSTDSLMPVLRTALVINWTEKAMINRYNRFRIEFKEIRSLADLNAIVEATEAGEFCRKYLNIEANSQHPEKNPKYKLLTELTKGFLEYKNHYRFSTEIEALRHWSSSVDMRKVRSDFIGKRSGIGPGVIENIRRNLGYSVIKPDRHVLGVLKQRLGLQLPAESYNELAEFLGVDARYFDCILFRYGQANGISG